MQNEELLAYGKAARLDTCFSHAGQYQRSRLGVSQPKSVCTTRLLLSKKERWIFNNLGRISDPYPLVGTSIIFYRGVPKAR